MLLFGSKHSNAYTESKIRFSTMPASAVAVAIDDALHFDGMKRAQEESRSEHERLKLLLDFTNAVASNLDFQELLHATLANVRRVMKCDAIWIHLPDAERKHLTVIARDPSEKGFYEDLRIPPIEDTIVGRVLLEGKPIVVRTITELLDFEEYQRRPLERD